MTPPRLIVCERTSAWAVALRWALADSGLRVYETRTLADAWQQLVLCPASLLALELRGGNLGEIVRLLVQQRQTFPNAAMVVLARREHADCEWVLREAGAIHVVTSQRDLVPLARLVRRFIQQTSAPNRSLLETIWDRLPWGSP